MKVTWTQYYMKVTGGFRALKVPANDVCLRAYFDAIEQATGLKRDEAAKHLEHARISIPGAQFWAVRLAWHRNPGLLEVEGLQ